MPPKVGQKEESRTRILAGAGRGFRRHGYGGAGVDALAREAGVTSGAFYAHFVSKAAAFREAVTAGLRDLRAGVEAFRAAQPSTWQRAFVDFYLTQRRTCDLGESCAAQSLSAEVERADAATRRAYTAELREVLEAMSTAGEGEGRAEAIALLSLMVGSVTLARAVDDPDLSEEIAAAAREAAGKIVGEKRRKKGAG